MQAFINLIQRHEQPFYHFVHKVHSKGETLFDSLMHWIELFLTIVREGIGSSLSLEFLLPHMGKERDDIMAEVDKVALHHYKLKVAHEAKIRRRFRRMQESGGADVEDEATQVLVNGVVGEIDFGELVHGDAEDMAAEDTDEDSDEYDEDESESGSTDDDSDDDSDDDDSDEESSSEESNTNHSRPTSDSNYRPPPMPGSLPHKRSLSIRSSVSVQSSRQSQDSSLPATPRSATSDVWKPLPPSPGVRLSSDSRPPASPSRRSHDALLTIPYKPPSKQGYEALARLRRESLSKSSDHGSSSRLGLHESPSKLSQVSSSKQSILSSKDTNGPPPVPPKPKSKKKAAIQVPKAPELQYIPKLLPVFIEMVRFHYIFGSF